MRKKTKKAKKPLHPLTQLRKLTEARMGRVMDSYPDDPPKNTPPLYDFVETFPVRKGIAGYSENYQSLQSWAQKKAADKAQAQKEKEGRKSFAADERKLKRVKKKGKRNNPDLKKKKCDPSGGTTDSMCIENPKWLSGN